MAVSGHYDMEMGATPMTEKELHKLKRHDLLSLLVAQGQEGLALETKLAETDGQLNETTRLSERLKERLNEKDAQIERLKERLNEKDAQIERLKEKLDEKDARIHLLEKQVEEIAAGRYAGMENVESLSDISLRLEMMLRAAQKAADRYMKQVQAPPAPAQQNPKGAADA